LTYFFDDLDTTEMSSELSEKELLKLVVVARLSRLKKGKTKGSVGNEGGQKFSIE